MSYTDKDLERLRDGCHATEIYDAAMEARARVGVLEGAGRRWLASVKTKLQHARGSAAEVALERVILAAPPSAGAPPAPPDAPRCLQCHAPMTTPAGNPGMHMAWCEAAAPTPRETEGVDGKCCACGYTGETEIECPKRPGDSCCEHWWEGTPEDQPAAPLSSGDAEVERHGSGET